MRYTLGNAQHIGARGQQQDSAALSDADDRGFVKRAGLLAVIADGMGGLANGAEASRIAVRTLLSEYGRKAESESVPEALRRAIRAAHHAILALNRGAGGADAGTTLAATVAHKGSLYWVTAGDSRIYLLRRGALTQVNEDHNFGQKLLHEAVRGQRAREEARQDPQQDHLTSYLGAPNGMEIEQNFTPLPLETGDTVILCTDGVYRALTAEEFVTAFQEEPAEACETIKSLVLSKAREQQDNLTVVAFRCKEKGSRLYKLAARPAARVALLVGAVGVLLGADIALGIWAARSRRSHLDHPRPTATVLVPANTSAGGAGQVGTAEGSPSAPSEQKASGQKDKKTTKVH